MPQACHPALATNYFQKTLSRFSCLVFVILLILSVTVNGCHDKLCGYGPTSKCPSLKLPNGVTLELERKLMTQSRYEEITAAFNDTASTQLAVCRVPDCLSSPCVHGDCVETDSDYICLNCPMRYEGRNCEKLKGPLLFVPDRDSYKVYISGLQDLNFTELMSFSSGPQGMAFDYYTQTLYWTFPSGDDVFWQNLVDGSSATVPNLPEGMRRPLCTSQSTRMLYIAYTDEPHGAILAISLDDPDGNYTTFQQDIDKIKAMVADDVNNYLYWARETGINRKRLDGSTEMQQIYENSALTNLKGITFDANGGNIIFCDQDNYLAFYMNVSSSNGLVGPAVEIKRTAFGAPAFEPIGVAIYNGTVYWLIAPRNTISVMPHYDAGNPFLDYTENEIVTFSKGRNIYIP